MQKPTSINIMRHGLPEGGDIFRGATDVALTEQGLGQMFDAYGKLFMEGSVPDVIVTSPMLRCVDFAKKIAEKYQLTIDIQNSFRELSFGDWDGKAFSEIKKTDEARFNQYWQDPIKYSPPNAEPMLDFTARIRQAYYALLEQYKGRNILLVTHGGVVRSLISEVLQSEAYALMRYEVPYACISQIRVYHEGDLHHPQLVYHNR